MASKRLSHLDIQDKGAKSVELTIVQFQAGRLLKDTTYLSLTLSSTPRCENVFQFILDRFVKLFYVSKDTMYFSVSPGGSSNGERLLGSLLPGARFAARRNLVQLRPGQRWQLLHLLLRDWLGQARPSRHLPWPRTQRHRRDQEWLLQVSLEPW